MTKRDPGGRKRRLKRINEARRRRKDEIDVDVGGISRLETTTTTTTADNPPTRGDFGGDAMMMMAVDKVVAKHAMKKATKKAKFLESACASVYSLFRSARWNAWTSGSRSNCCVVLFVSSNCVNRLTTPLFLAPFLRKTSSCARAYAEIRRTHESNPASRASISKKQQSSKSKQKKRKSIQFGLADFAKDLNASLLETTASIRAKSTRSKKMSKMLSNALGGNKKNGSTSSSNSKNKKREFIARVENERMKMVLKHPTFKENPVKAVLTHLAAQLETADESADEEDDEGNGKNAGKNENNTLAHAKKKRKMTPAQLRQTQGEHHAGPSERSKKSIHRSSALGGQKAKKKPKRT